MDMLEVLGSIAKNTTLIMNAAFLMGSAFALIFVSRKKFEEVIAKLRKEEIEPIRNDQESLDKRLAAVESKLTDLPTKEDIHELALQGEKTAGEVKKVEQAVKGIGKSMADLSQTSQLVLSNLMSGKK